MKITVIHDKKGRIQSAGAPAPEFAGQVHLVPGKNQHAVEINTSVKEPAVKDLADLRLMSDKKHAARVAPVWRELTEKFRVDSEGKLQRKKKKK